MSINIRRECAKLRVIRVDRINGKRKDTTLYICDLKTAESVEHPSEYRDIISDFIQRNGVQTELIEKTKEQGGKRERAREKEKSVEKMEEKKESAIPLTAGLEAFLAVSRAVLTKQDPREIQQVLLVCEQVQKTLFKYKSPATSQSEELIVVTGLEEPKSMTTQPTPPLEASPPPAPAETSWLFSKTDQHDQIVPRRINPWYKRQLAWM